MQPAFIGHKFKSQVSEVKCTTGQAISCFYVIIIIITKACSLAYLSRFNPFYIFTVQFVG
jgi:hypothetical protein